MANASATHCGSLRGLPGQRDDVTHGGFVLYDVAAAGATPNLTNPNGYEHQYSQTQTLPQFPGEDALKHVADRWIEVAETRLGGMNLLSVARGGTTPESQAIKDMEPLPELPPTHPQYERRREHRHRVAQQNDVNAEQRFIIEMKAWTKLYDMIRSSVESSSQMLAKEWHAQNGSSIAKERRPRSSGAHNGLFRVHRR